MEMQQLFLSCRNGNLSKIKELVEKGIEINLNDRYDNTPLYYACLCGHYEIVNYLIENGAYIENAGFAYERCYRSTNDIYLRPFLSKSKTVICKEPIARPELFKHLEKFYYSRDYSDVRLVVNNEEEYFAHKCILIANSKYFETKLKNTRQTFDVHLTLDGLNKTAFEALLGYIYSGRLTVSTDDVADLAVLAKHFQVVDLFVKISKLLDKKHNFVENNNRRFSVRYLYDNLTGKGDFVIEDRSPDYANLLGNRFNTTTERELFDGKFLPDIGFEVENVLFKCHKIFVSRSEFLKSLFANTLEEEKFLFCASYDSTDIPVVKIPNVTIATFRNVLHYIYCDNINDDLDNAQEMLITADFFMLFDMKTKCAEYMSKYIDSVNVYELLKSALILNVPILEEKCCRYLAINYDDVFETDDYCEFLKDIEKNGQRERVTNRIASIGKIFNGRRSSKSRNANQPQMNLRKPC